MFFAIDLLQVGLYKKLTHSYETVKSFNDRYLSVCLCRLDTFLVLVNGMIVKLGLTSYVYYTFLQLILAVNIVLIQYLEGSQCTLIQIGLNEVAQSCPVELKAMVSIVSGAS